MQRNSRAHELQMRRSVPFNCPFRCCSMLRAGMCAHYQFIDEIVIFVFSVVGSCAGRNLAISVLNDACIATHVYPFQDTSVARRVKGGRTPVSRPVSTRVVVRCCYASG
eukprot:TRINITY_DN32230_c0_g1_i1.p1 TRINITY_DN32230_c0_g1~~TRINITY_DN32230_c0_g1_i1.p1  ORF type:complete len:109 (+),score=0.25 TRINITY_DN32230_c0_g1_i1:1-327(+)